MTDDLRERLAAQAHDSWSGWMRYLFSKCEPVAGVGNAVLIPEWAVERWQRQMNTPYDELPESEKASDRREADKYLHAILEGYPGGTEICYLLPPVVEGEGGGFLVKVEERHDD